MKFIPVARLGQRREEGRAGGGSCGSGRRGLRRRGRVHQVGWEGGGLVRRGEDALVRVGGGPGLFGGWGLLLGSEGRVGLIVGLLLGSEGRMGLILGLIPGLALGLRGRRDWLGVNSIAF